MPFPSLLGDGLVLDFLSNCESACQRFREQAALGVGEACMRTLQRTALSNLQLLYDLPMRTLNNRLKRYPFVDPKQFDQLLAEIFDAILDWMQWVTKPNWLVDVLHHIGKLSPESAKDLVKAAVAGHKYSSENAPVLSEDVELELEQLGRFTYPLPLKLRDMQAMVYPFMEVRSSHYIAGLDAVVAELVSGLLRLYHVVKAWDDVLVGHIQKIAEANLSLEEEERTTSIMELCATMEMDTFEACHRLHMVNAEMFALTSTDIEVISQKLDSFKDQAVLDGPPTLLLDHGGMSRLIADELGGCAAGESPLMDVREEAFRWWREQGFAVAAPCSVLANTLLDYFVDNGFHPDPFVTMTLPTVLERIFGVQISLNAWMNRLLPRLGGFVDSTGVEVAPGRGLPFFSDVRLCAESLLVFLRHWGSLIEDDKSQPERIKLPRMSGVRRATQFNMNAYLNNVLASGHSVKDVVDLLEGATPIPPHVLQVPVDTKRYKIDDDTRHMWEIATHQLYEVVEMGDENHRDLGPYRHLDLNDPERLAEDWAHTPKAAWCLTNPDLEREAKKGYQISVDSIDEEDSDDEQPPSTLTFLPGRSQADISDTFGLRLADFPADFASSEPQSTFLTFFAEDHRSISRWCLEDLPGLPWSFGADPRNAIILDVPGVALFQCSFTKSHVKKDKACIVPSGDPVCPTYIVCPKYQPLQLRNGDRLVCGQWTFELRIEPTRIHGSSLKLLSDDGGSFEVPMEGCHVGATSRSRQLEHQPSFPPLKYVLKHRLKDIAAVHMAFYYQSAVNRWMLVDHSPLEFGTMLCLREGVAYPLSQGTRLKFGPVIMEVISEA